MFRIALRDTRENWVRFLMSILAVLLATAFVGATFSFTNMLGDSIGRISDSTNTGDIYVRGQEIESEGETFGPPQREPVPIDVVETIREVDGVTAAGPGLFGMATLVGDDGRAVSNGAAPTLGGNLIEGIDDFEVVEGRMPEAAGEIVLEEQTLELSGYEVGDTAPVILGDSLNFEATIVGEVDSGWSLMGATFVFISEEDGLAAFAPTGVVSSITIAVADGTEVEEVIAAVGAALDEKIEVVSGEVIREESETATAQAMSFIEVFMLVFAFIAFFVGSFLIVNTFTMLVRQRQREFALLRAIGASPGQVVWSLTIQAIIIGLVGSVLGIGAGVLIVMGAQRIFEAMGTPMEGNPWLAPERAVIVVVLAVVFTVGASLLPARRAAATAPVEAMRPEDPKPERTTRIRGVVSAIGVIAGLAAVGYAISEKSGPAIGVGAALILLGVLGLGPLIVPPVLGVLAAPFRVVRPIGKLARGNVLRTPKRTAATAAALTVGMTLVSATAVLAASAEGSTRSIIENQMSADYYVGSQMSFVPATVQQPIEDFDSVSGVTAAHFGAVRAIEPAAGDLTISALTERGFEELLTVPIIEGDRARADGEVVVSKRLWEEDGVEPGDILTFSVPGGENVELRVTGVTNDSFMSTDLYALDSAYEKLVPEQTRAIAFLLVNSAGDLDATRADLESAIEEHPNLQVLDQEELADQMVNIIATMLNILYALLGLSLVIAVLSIVNTLAMAVMERNREIGLMRAVGLSGGQLTAMIIVESILTALFGTILGTIMGVGLGSALQPILVDMGLTHLVVPWEPIVVILAGTVVVGVIAALWPAWRALRQPVLEAVASE